MMRKLFSLETKKKRIIMLSLLNKQQILKSIPLIKSTEKLFV